MKWFGRKQKDDQQDQGQAEADISVSNQPVEAEDKANWFSRLTSGLGKTSQALVSGIEGALGVRPIIDDDVIEAIQQLATGKSPGIDGIPAEVYIEFQDILVSPIMKMMQEVKETGRLSETQSESVIVILHKKNARGEISNYRPMLNIGNARNNQTIFR